MILMFGTGQQSPVVVSELVSESLKKKLKAKLYAVKRMFFFKFEEMLILCGTSLMAQWVKNLPAMQEMQGSIPGWEDPLVEKRATHSSVLA